MAAARLPAVQWLILLGLVIVSRGSEGLGVPVSMDVNDTIVFYQIWVSEDFPATAIASQFSRAIIDMGTTFWPTAALSKMGLAPEGQFFVLYLAQMATLALGLLFVFRSFDERFAYVMLATVLTLLSGYTGFGRYLALGGAFKIVSSTFAMTIGFIALAMYLRAQDARAAVLAALLATYHPSHGLVLLTIIFGHSAWASWQGRISPPALRRTGIVTAISLVPFVLLVVARLPAAQAYDPVAWWAYVFSKTSNLTPLQDGVLVVFAILATMILGAVAAWPAADRSHGAPADAMRRAVALIAAVLGLWLAQILFSEVLHSVSLTQLALTRATPYAVLAIVAVFALKAFRAFGSNDPVERATAIILTLGVVGAALPGKFQAGIPPLINISWVNQGNVVEQSKMALLTAALAWWAWLPRLDASRQALLTRLLAGAVVLWVLFLGLRLPMIAVALALYVRHRQGLATRLSFKPVWIATIIGIVALFVLTGRNPWKPSEAERIRNLVSTIAAHVKPNATILNIPAADRAAEVLIPTRATFIGWGEGQYLIYLPALEQQVTARLELLGVRPVVHAPECADWLLKPMCRRQLYLARALDHDDSWRGRLGEMRKLTPTLSHALVRQPHVCVEDKPVASVDDLALIPLASLAPRGCTRGKQ